MPIIGLNHISFISTVLCVLDRNAVSSLKMQALNADKFDFLGYTLYNDSAKSTINEANIDVSSNCFSVK